MASKDGLGIKTECCLLLQNVIMCRCEFLDFMGVLLLYHHSLHRSPNDRHSYLSLKPSPQAEHGSRAASIEICIISQGILPLKWHSISHFARRAPQCISMNSFSTHRLMKWRLTFRIWWGNNLDILHTQTKTHVLLIKCQWKLVPLALLSKAHIKL